jgi:hypothetical protein
MHIQFTDDKKEKYQSVRAETVFSCTTPMGHADVTIEGFGANEAEAVAELKHIARKATIWLAPNHVSVEEA